jgi:hypothetical protein
MLPQVYSAAALSNASAVASIPAAVTDDYSPCSIAPDHGNTLVYNVTLPAGSKNDTLSVEMCSPGGYDQVRGPFSSAHPAMHPAMCAGCRNTGPLLCMSTLSGAALLGRAHALTAPPQEKDR